MESKWKEIYSNLRELNNEMLIQIATLEILDQTYQGKMTCEQSIKELDQIKNNSNESEQK